VIVYDAAGNRVIAPNDMDAHEARRLRKATGSQRATALPCGCQPDANPPVTCPQHAQLERVHGARGGRGLGRGKRKGQPAKKVL